MLVDRRRKRIPPDPPPGTFPVVEPTFEERAGRGELTATWMGHATVLLQIGRLNVLTDPMWSERASPVSFAGPKRLVAPPIALDALPPIDVVLLSHNHYDHLDRSTVARLAKRQPSIAWLVPLGLGATVSKWGAREVHELDWWGEYSHEGVRFACTPARHFSARGFGDRGDTLWCGWSIVSAERRVYFAGDTAYFPEFSAIAARYGPFDLALLPIGAYEPRWFMENVHMNPEDALRAYRELRQDGHPTAVLPIHWGTFRLTDEAMEEPPRRYAERWTEARLPRELLWLLRHGETRRA
jgi:N-acyl-phosphatidylethanolamine-hydrolysing phospholipase D